jgi:hypothetical protein
MNRWIQHPVLVWSLLCLFGVPNVLGQGFHIAIHHSHQHGSATESAATGCAHAHSHAPEKSTPAKRHSCGHHRHSHSGPSLAERDAQPRLPSVSERGHDHHDCSICQYFATAQVLAKPTECLVSVAVTSPPSASLPAFVFCEQYSASSPRGPPAV